MTATTDFTAGHYSNFVDKLAKATAPLSETLESLRKEMDNADDRYEEIEQEVLRLEQEIRKVKCTAAGIPAADWPELESALWGDRRSRHYALVWGHGPYDDLGLND